MRLKESLVTHLLLEGVLLFHLGWISWNWTILLGTVNDIPAGLALWKTIPVSSSRRLDIFTIKITTIHFTDCPERAVLLGRMVIIYFLLSHRLITPWIEVNYVNYDTKNNVYLNKAVTESESTWGLFMSPEPREAHCSIACFEKLMSDNCFLSCQQV